MQRKFSKRFVLRSAPRHCRSSFSRTFICPVRFRLPRKQARLDVLEALAMPQTIVGGARPGEILSGFETRADLFEMEYQEKLVSDFLAGAPQKLGRVRTGHHALVNSKREDVCLDELFEMRRQARLLAGAAGGAGFCKVAQLGDV